MAKRKLSKLQHRRRQKQESKSIHRALNNIELDDDSLGPEKEGLVIAHFGTEVEVKDRLTQQHHRCHIRAKVSSLVAGDNVVWREGPKQGVIESCLPRNTLLSRPDAYGNLKPVASNVDQILITIAVKPEPFSNLIDRYLVAAETHQITPILVINKTDLLEEFKRDKILKLSALYERLGYRVLHVSANSNKGVDELQETLKDKISIFVGQSGVGKSSLVKALIPDLDIKIGSLSHTIDKGKHTTTHSQLFEFPLGGAFIDSPGVREFGLWHVEKDKVIDGFPELKEAASQCKFRNCSHNKEPHCGIKQALKANTISAERFHNYQHILASLDEVEIKNKQH